MWVDDVVVEGVFGVVVYGVGGEVYVLIGDIVGWCGV